MKGKETWLQKAPVSEKPIIPDQILTEPGVKYEEADAVMAGCPGYEWLDEPSPPN